MPELPLFDPFKELEQIRRERCEAVDPELSQKLSQAPAKEFHQPYQSVDPTFATFATFAGVHPAHAVAHARVKEEEGKNNIIISCTYARNEHAGEAALDHATDGSAKAAKAAKERLSYSSGTGNVKTGTAKVFEGGLRKWHFCLAAMSPDTPPCPGYRANDWPRVLARAIGFLDTFGVQAEALGWTSARLFGVHPDAGIIRVDACGALALPIGGVVRAITATEIAFGHLTHREKPGQPEGVPFWEFGR